MRLSLGATQGRLLRQLLTESLVVALLGGAAGLMASAWLAEVLVVLFAGTRVGDALVLTPAGESSARLDIRDCRRYHDLDPLDRFPD